jgi:cell division protein FtsZ
MTLNLTRSRQPQELRPRIVVFGVGGAGCNAVNNMIRLKLEGVECVVANTDAQALAQTLAERKIQLGLNITQGLGAGSRPEIGRAATEEAWEEVVAQLQGVHMVFITAGMGGGTGTGAAPVVARAAREQGLLTVAVVTKPFHFEGAQRMRLAEAGLQELQSVVDTMIVIPNQNLFRVANEKTTFADAFHMADQVLYSGVRGITDLMVMPGLINLDFADIRTVMSEMGKAMMGSGEADGQNRAIEAAERAISNPLLDDTSMTGARGLLINITGGPDLTLFEVDEAANRVRDEVDPQANIIFGSAFDESLQGRIRVSVFATGIDRQVAVEPKSEHTRQSARVQQLRPVATEAEPMRPTPVVERPRPVPLYTPAAPLAAAAQTAHPSVVAVAPSASPTPRYLAARRETQPASSAAREQLPAATREQAPAAVVRPQVESDEPAQTEQTQHDMFGRGADEQPAAPVAAPASVQPRVDPRAIVAYVDDIEPARSSPETPRHGSAAADARGQKPSLFNLWRGRRPEPARAPARPISSPTLIVGSAARPQTRSQREDARASAAQRAPVVREPVEQRSKEEDLLEIPAFLRRQAN